MSCHVWSLAEIERSREERDNPNTQRGIGADTALRPMTSTAVKSDVLLDAMTASKAWERAFPYKYGLEYTDREVGERAHPRGPGSPVSH